MKNKDALIDQIREAIQSAYSIVVIGHDRPDGDAIGSSLAMGLFLESIGKEVTVLNNNRVPNQLLFLPEIDKVMDPDDVHIDADLVIVLDSAGKDRVNRRVWEAVEGCDGPVINIDHHISNTNFGDINYVDSVSPATAQIVSELAEAFGWSMTSQIADHLYTGISTDTGSFQYPNTTAKTYRIIAGLVDAGADVGRLNQMLYENYPARRVQLLRTLLQDMRLDYNGRCVSVCLTKEVSRELGVKPGDAEGIIDVIRAIDSVIVAVFFEEFPDGKVRVSSRSKSDEVSVSKICGKLGGGGHTRAAGVRLAGPLGEATEIFLEEVGESIAAAED